MEKQETGLETVFAGVRLQSPVVNAAGTCKTVEDVERFAQMPVGAITVGSITVEPRELNPGNTYWMDPEGRYSLNSLGLPNGGIPYYEEALPKMRRIATDVGKPLIVSVAGFSPEEYGELDQLAVGWADMVELNLGCPNVWGEDSNQKPIASYEPQLVEEILNEVGKKRLESLIEIQAPLTLKLSPLPPNLLAPVAEVINRSIRHCPWLRGVVASNTWPNGFGWDGTKTAITPGGGKAGFAGPGFKGIALGQVVQFQEFLGLPGHSIDVMGAGGVQGGGDVQDYRLAGAKAVGINTAFTNKGFRVFPDVLAEYAELLQSAVP